MKSELKENNLVKIIFDEPTEFDITRDDPEYPIQCMTIGWIVKHDDESIKISWIKHSENSPYIGLNIPRGCIKKISLIHSNNRMKFMEDQK